MFEISNIQLNGLSLTSDSKPITNSAICFIVVALLSYLCEKYCQIKRVLIHSVLANALKYTEISYQIGVLIQLFGEIWPTCLHFAVSRHLTTPQPNQQRQQILDKWRQNRVALCPDA